MNKNVAIFILVVLIFIGGIWGSLADGKRKDLEKKLQETLVQLQKVTAQSTKQQKHVLGKTAGLQKTLAEKEEQVNKARKELVSLRKEIKALESQLSGCTADLQNLTQEHQALVNAQGIQKKNPQQSDSGQQPVEEQLPTTDQQSYQAATKTAQDTDSLQAQLNEAELTIATLQQRLNSANAQMIGLEKLLEEKNAAMEETSQEMDRLEINMDVLLSKIADQRDQLQELQEEKRELVKELAAKNEIIADLQEEVIRQPVQE